LVADSRGNGAYHNNHKQFDTVRAFRTAYHNQAACLVMNSGLILLLGDKKGEYQQFAQGSQDCCLESTLKPGMQEEDGAGLEAKQSN
jgi:hypothetical protein